MNEMLSINELNIVLEKLQKDEKLSNFGTFSEVDIVFVSGLFLWFKQHEKGWQKIPRFFDMDLKSRDIFNHSHYFKQIEILYNVKYDNIFENFPHAKNIDANPFSRYFAPPIYITNETIDCFFEKGRNDSEIGDLKETYIEKFLESDLSKLKNDELFSRYYKLDEPELNIFINNLKQDLYKNSAIFTFIFLVAHFKILKNEITSQVETKKKGRNKIKKTYKEFIDDIEKTWHFTQEYVRGLHELARNIVEHSGEKPNCGQGMITIRAYSISEKDKTKILETHVFDYGEKGILPKLRNYTEQYSTDDTITNPSVKGCYTADLDVLTSDFKLTNFVNPKGKPLSQQTFRHIGHYGINKLQKLVEEKPLEGEMYISSRGIDGERDYYKDDNAKSHTVGIGTSYFFEIPFKSENFWKIKLPILKDTQINTFGYQESLKELLQKRIEHVSIKELQNINENFKGILNIIISEKITKENFNEISKHLLKIPKTLDKKVVIALNLENGVDGESNLLRFLGYLSFEFKERSFVLYNLDFEIFNKMVEDNKAFVESRKWQFFWNGDKNNGLLVFTKHKDGNNKEFYFADVLYGSTIEDYNYVNKAIHNTFPNSATVVDINVRNTISGNINYIEAFFYNNALLPYDILLEKEKSPLFLTNIETILQNNLFDRELFKNNGYYPTQIIENYIANFDGYRIYDTHFKIGNKIHSADFYYAKRLFQNSFYTVRLALYLAREIKNKIDIESGIIVQLIVNEINSIFNTKISITDLAEVISNNLTRLTGNRTNEKGENIITKTISIITEKQDEINTKYVDAKATTEIFQGISIISDLSKKISDIVKKEYTKEPIALVGYEMYSELLLSLVEKFLRDIYEYQVIHFIVRNKDDKMVFLQENTFKDYIREYNKQKTIIIVPIAATGSTTRKIENEIRNRIYKHIYKQEIDNKKSKDEAKNEAEKQKKQYDFFEPRYNVILAQPSTGFDDIKNEDPKQKSVIEVPAHWERLKDCPLCYGNGAKPLFETDNSSLTPSLIFGNPKGQTKSKRGNEIESIIDFNNLNFEKSIGYKTITRNDNYRIYDVDSDIFIKKNIDNIVKWLQQIKCYLETTECYPKIKEYHQRKIETIDKKQRDNFLRNYKSEINREDSIEESNFKKYVDLYKVDKSTAYNQWLKTLPKYLTPTDNVVIVAPCHESNTQFLNLINEHVFSSSATIIHHQNSVDFEENFTLLNKNYLTGEKTKVFYVDDSLITGSHFFELFDLIKGATGKSMPLTASILLNDQAVPFVHERAVRWSNNYFAFATYNQPPTLNILTNQPLEHERKRYELIQNNVLHDTLCEHFFKKANKLNPNKPSFEEESSEKQIRRLKMFEATHKIYDFFTKKSTVPDLADDVKRKEFVEFKRNDNIEDEIGETDINRKALSKVLSQYPFILYENLRKKTFEWHKKLLSELPNHNENCFDPQCDYEKHFTTFKFRLRRAAFLGNYQVLEVDFLLKLLRWFIKIDEYIMQNKPAFISKIDKQWSKEKKEKVNRENNLLDFPIFVLGNYAEMIQKNAWIAYEILKNIKQDKELLLKLKDSNQGRQFYNMLQIEAATVIDDFMKMINNDYSFHWRNMYNNVNPSELYPDTDRIIEFFNKNSDLLKTNKFELVKETILENSDDWLKMGSSFVNYLWIKQLLHADGERYIEIDYLKEINAVIDKMKGFFPNKENIQAFFIVTDRQENPHVLFQDNNLLDEYSGELKTVKDSEQTDNLQAKILIDFFEGKPCKTGNARETTAEFVFENQKGKNIYTDENVTLEFIPSEYKWLYLIRISKLEEDINGTSKFETQGLLGFYSKEDLKESILPKQLLMLLRKDMSAFIDRHNKNDEFRVWIENENIRKVYESKFDKFHHSGKKFVETFQRLVSENDEKQILKAMSDVIRTQITFGAYYADYLEQKTRNQNWTISLHEESDNKYSEDNSKDIYLTIDALTQIYSDKFPNEVKCEILFTNFENIRSTLPYDYLKEIIIEIICNSLCKQGSKITINFDSSQLIATSCGRALPSDIKKLRRHIQSDFPIERGFGIGLFVIEKIIFNNFNQNIQIRNIETGEFQIIIPLNISI